RAATPHLPSPSAWPTTLCGEAASGNGRWEGLSCLTGHCHEQVLGEGRQQCRTLTGEGLRREGAQIRTEQGYRAGLSSRSWAESICSGSTRVSAGEPGTSQRSVRFLPSVPYLQYRPVRQIQYGMESALSASDLR